MAFLKYICKKHPGLAVYHNGDFLRFKGGVFITTDKAIQKKFERIADIEKISQVKSVKAND